MKRFAEAAVLVVVVGGALYSAHVDRLDQALMARAAWNEARALDEPGVAAKTLLCRMQWHEDTILAAGIASPDSFHQVVQSRLERLWNEYCRHELADGRAAATWVDLGTARPGEL